VLVVDLSEAPVAALGKGSDGKKEPVTITPKKETGRNGEMWRLVEQSHQRSFNSVAENKLPPDRRLRRSRKRLMKKTLGPLLTVAVEEEEKKKKK
jgi:hypothetical protein